MTRYGDWNSKNRELWEESQCLYPNGINPYALEYQRRFCCAVCKKHIDAGTGWFQRTVPDEKIHVQCYLSALYQGM